VEDPPQTLFSLKILFAECNDPNSPRDGNCNDLDLTKPSLLNLNIDNLVTPPSIVENSIGFQTLPPGFTQGAQTFPTGYTLTGSMNIDLSNVMLTSANGSPIPLASSNAAAVGKIGTNGDHVNPHYDLLTAAGASRLTNQNAAGYNAVLAPEMIAFAQAPNVAPALMVSTDSWPNQLNGVQVSVTDSQGQRRSAPIYYIAPTSVVYLVPVGTALAPKSL
jgi:hypothetical protein